jgi:hypothetical protein
MSYRGRCACGKVRVNINGAALVVRQCWCRRCQYFTGGGPAHNAMFRTEDLHLEGELATTTYVADSGNTIIQAFCPSCATPVHAHSRTRPQLRAVRLGVLEQPHDLAPQMVIWTEMAPPWAVFDPKLQRHARQPPAPVPQPQG